MTRRGITLVNLLITLVVIAAVAVAVVAVTRMDPRGERGPRTGRRYAEEVRAAGAIDPALVRWRESLPPMAVAMEEPAGIAVDARDRIHVVGDRLVILGANGEEIMRSAEHDEPYRACAVDSSGRVLAVSSRSVHLLGVEGDRLRVLRTVEIPEEVVQLSSVAVADDGVFAADSSGCRVYRLPLGLEPEADGGAACELFAEGFMVPSEMDVSSTPDGELVTVDPGRHRVQIRDVYGDVVSAFGEEGLEVGDFHGCCNPSAVAMLANGRTVTAEKGLGVTRVKVYDGDGGLESVVATPDQFDDRPDGPPIVLDVAVDSTGRVLVLDPTRRQVRVFTPIPRGQGGDER